MQLPINKHSLGLSSFFTSQIGVVTNITFYMLSNNRCTGGKSKTFTFHEMPLVIGRVITSVSNINVLHVIMCFPKNISKLRRTTAKQGLLTVLHKGKNRSKEAFQRSQSQWKIQFVCKSGLAGQEHTERCFFCEFVLLTCLPSDLEDHKNVLNGTMLKVPIKSWKRNKSRGIGTNTYLFLLLVTKHMQHIFYLI